MNITDILTEDMVIPELRAVGKGEALDEMTEALVAGHPEIDRRRLRQVLEDRERLGSTGIGGGVAIPHGKLPGLTRVLAVFGRSSRGVDFEAVDGAPTRLFFLLVAPEDSSGMHLKALARISRLLKEQGVRERLLACDDRVGLFGIIREAEAKY
jgi:PTS system nitrogen regulatory IIA component